MSTQAKREQGEAREELRKMLKPGDTVYTVLRHVSRSGMSRGIDCYVMQDGEPRWVSRLVHRATGFSFDKKRDCLRVGGCGMDMGYHVMMNVSYAIHGHSDKGDDAKEAGEKGRPFTPRPGHYRAGYSLKHRWL